MRSPLAGLAFIAIIAIPSVHRSSGEFAVRYRNLVFRGPVISLTAMPGETVALETVNEPSLGNRRWTWTAPTAPGLYPLPVISGDQRDTLTIQAFVLVPFNRVRQERVNGYRIGRYPRSAPASVLLLAGRSPCSTLEVMCRSQPNHPLRRPIAGRRLRC